MCTVTWILRDDGFDLVANRDEQRTRLPAHPPRVVRAGGSNAIMPVDADAGGTWIGVNEHALALCLLNGAFRRGEREDAAFTSRGLLVRDLLALETPLAVEDALRRTHLDAYRGFLLAVFAVGTLPVVHTWDGRSLATTCVARAPLVSSSRDPEEAGRSRRAVLEAWRGEHGTLPIDGLLAYHRSHEPERGATSVCMHRPDAQTVSLSHVRVTPREIGFRYAGGAPCRTAWTADVALARGGGRGQ